MELKNEERQQIASVLEINPQKIVLSNLKDKTYPYQKTVISQVSVKGRVMYQFERFTQKQAFHDNVEPSQLNDSIFQLFPNTYSQMNIFDAQAQWDYKVTKKGKLLSHTQGSVLKKASVDGVKKIVPDVSMELASHNRKKNYLLKEGTVIPPLVDLGVFTKEGKIVRTMYDKYRQINRFLELVEDVVKDYPNKNLHIVDFGCGKSYLTFILYYYLVEVKGYAVQMTGLDLKEDVIKKCNATAQKYGYSNLKFEMGDINGYQTDQPIDMVVTLHACDTATDYALYNAISWKAGIILSVPCCQHEINSQIRSEDFSILTKYGIVKERVSALMTDAIRANVLTMCGYRTQILEFVDFAASPKNLLIRAVRGQVSGQKKEQAKKEIDAICKEFSISQTLVKLLEEK
ncbi:MAG: SAM-dependent methyltransferase [Eubacteriales bacterium]|nr:SAM-dependent methyltransferase [Eubacteriales bacterium]